MTGVQISESATQIAKTRSAARFVKSARGLWPWLAAMASGCLAAFCFPRFDQEWLCWIALTPLICAVWFSPRRARRQWLRDAALGYVAGIVFFTITFGWLSSLGILFGELWLRFLPFILSFYLGLYFAAWGWFIGLFRNEEFANSRRNLGVGFCGACAWVGLEWIRGWLFSGFGWNGLGVALHADLPMIQITAFTGVAGLSFLIAFSNLMIVLIARRIGGEIGPTFAKRIRWEFSFSVALLVLVFSYGIRTLFRAGAAPAASLYVAAVQPNIPQSEKFDSSFEDKIFARLDSLTTFAAAAQPQLILWPEAATPRGIWDDEINYRFVINQARRGDFALLIGTLDSDLQLGEVYNVAALLTDRGAHAKTYRKIHLVPFGEYMPLRHSFPLFAMIAGELVPGDITPGRDFHPLDLPSPRVKVAPLICFEDTLGDLTRRFVANGAQVLINITNDGWFLQSAGSEQHLANAVFRAVENRRPLVRCANTGVTCSVDPFGRVDRWLKPFEQGFAARQIPIPDTLDTTFYTRHGDLFSIACAAAACGCLLLRARRR
jgi:apolipoprotein N-acyltransferase